MYQLMRPIQLKLAILFCFIGLLINLAYIPLNMESYGTGWLIIFAVKLFVSFFWAAAFILILKGSSWPRYVYSAFVIYALVKTVYLGAFSLLDFWVITSLLASFGAIILWFLPQSNNWFKVIKNQAS
ncbi:hypothetical protein RI845_00325 [Thalassotalea nanhaiensis]|uniref:Uncharacterized protein n=1 Tax=Thalassotalea nanhaiensis TaxID=3065648 RepID=A0ABY9TK30_9GAMM|nr:hypothetical protein RI845_00325 [Colwelliaceae bacterium SQ345]